MITLEKYTELVFPIIEHCAKASLQDDFTKDHIWYLNRQIFYGFGAYHSTKIYYSKEASIKFIELYLKYEAKCNLKKKTPKKITIETLTWAQQPIIDERRAQLIFEHMYTGTMFREDVMKLYESKKEFNVAAIVKIIEDNYSVCIITKDENKKLHKTQRGEKPFKYYEDQKIKIVN